MLSEIMTVLGPLKLIITMILFFNLAWIALQKWLALLVVGLSIGETPLMPLWLQLHAFTAPASGGATHQLLCATLANALLAVAIGSAVRGLQRWARSTVKRHEDAFWALIKHEERLARAQARAAGIDPRRR
ncbi:MAG: hypothetical protein QM661_02605 [Solimonas sp.]